MNQEQQDTSAVLMDTMVAKVEKQDQRIRTQEQEIVALKAEVRQIPDYSKEVQEIKTGLQDFIAVLKKLEFPTGKMEELSKRLATALALLRQPVTNTIKHHHYVPKIIWIAAGLFLSLCLVCSGWYMTADTLSQYRANDTKYRKMRLTADSVSLQYFRQLDSLYAVDPAKMRSDVTEQERLKQERLELLDQIQTVNSKIEQPAEKAGEKKSKGR